MRSKRTPIQHWLSLRIRLLCIGVFVVSLFIPPYVAPETSAAAPDMGEQTSQFLLVEDGFIMKTSSLTEQGTRKAFSRSIIHTVEAKESVETIARLYDVRPDTIRYANNLKPSDTLKPGQKLTILPVDGILHTVKRGQNLSAIAELYGVSVSIIAEQNKIKNGYLLAGQELIIPGGKPIIVAPPVLVAGSPAIDRTASSKTPTRTGNPDFPVKAPQAYRLTPTYGILQKPCDCFLTQSFSNSHYAVDLQDKGGGPIFAAEGGTVIRADYGWNGGYGNVIEIDHGNGMVTLYGHNKELYVKEGDAVTRGQNIAFMGHTGLVHGPTGIHLHFEVIVKGVKRNPLLYIQE